MRTKQPDTITIDGMLCECPRLAMKRLGMQKSAFNELVAASKNGMAKTPLRFIQYNKNAPRWFPVEWMHEFIQELGRSVRPAVGDRASEMIRKAFAKGVSG